MFPAKEKKKRSLQVWHNCVCCFENPQVVFGVIVVKNNGSWECKATEATVVEECPADVAQQIRDTTTQDGEATSLTKKQAVDYETTPPSLQLLEQGHVLAAEGLVFSHYMERGMQLEQDLTQAKQSFEAAQRSRAFGSDDYLAVEKAPPTF